MGRVIPLSPSLNEPGTGLEKGGFQIAEGKMKRAKIYPISFKASNLL
jgi:hypothetical protein